MKNSLIAAMLVLGASSVFAQTTTFFADFNTAPTWNDGRDGWRHGAPRTPDKGLNPGVPCDYWSTAEWNFYIDRGVLVCADIGGGNGDWIVAPSKFLVNGGNFAGLTSGTMSLDFARITPSAAATNNPVSVRFYSGSAYVQRTLNLPANVISFVNLWTGPMSFDLKNSAGYTLGGGAASFADVMAAVDKIAIDIEVAGVELNMIDDIKITYDAGSGPETVLSDFNTQPNGDSGRMGFIHNRTADGYNGSPQGDVASHIRWDTIDGLNGVNGGLRVYDMAAGFGEIAVFPETWIPAAGRGDLLGAGSQLKFKFRREYPASVTPANAGSIYFQIMSGTSYLRRTFSVAEIESLYPDFYVTIGSDKEFTVDLNDFSSWSVGAYNGDPVKPVSEILANVERLMMNGEAASGREINFIDDIELTLIQAPKVEGQITFSDLTESARPDSVTIEFRNAGTLDVIQTSVAPVDANGNYVIRQPATPGTYDVSIQTRTFLRKTITNVVCDGTATATANFVLINGDTTPNDNEVGPSDFEAVVAAFGLTSSDPGYNAGFDVDGDGEIGPSDFEIVVANFGLAGDQ
jgi:hypothetical protein